MKTTNVTIREATEKWVNEMNAIPTGMLERFVDELTEITSPEIGDRVYVFEHSECGEITKIDSDNYTIKLDNGKETECNIEDFEVQKDSYFPMWGTMWSFGNSIDNYWLENHIQEMSNCGFRIYEHEEYGYFFGIDGCGYDFYGAHWIPLYKARGLQWHDEEE